MADGTCERVDRARAKALTDLVTGHATVEVQVVLTAPAAAEPSDGLAEVSAPGSTDPVLVDRVWLDRVRAARVAACDPVSGALVDDGESLATGAYRPGKELTELVKARDGRCRFPGCHVAARCCDLDHLTPWPAGPTTAGNLACLCRRHHRTKQRPGWTVRIHPDATLTWTDPTGRTRTTHPIDHLHRIELPATAPPPDPNPPPGIPCLTLPDTPHSTLEHRHEHHLGSPRARPTTRTDTHDLTFRRFRVTTPSCRTRQRPRASGGADPPPF